MSEKPYQVHMREGIASISYLTITASGDPVIEELTIRGIDQHSARRVAVALNLAYQRGQQTAVKRIAKGLQADPRAIHRLAM